MEKKISLLVVEDDPRMCRMLERILEREGYEITAAGSGEHMLELMETGCFDLMILDRMLPDGDSVQFAQALRVKSTIPIIMLTAMNDTKDRILGLDVGADDYIAKPFEEGELLARVRSLLRRTRDTCAENETNAGTRLAIFTGWELAHETRSLVSSSGLNIPLSELEYRLFNLFATHPNKVLSRERIMAAVMGREWDPFDRSVDVLVGKLRRKLEATSKPPELIQSVRGEGYRFCASIDAH